MPWVRWILEARFLWVSQIVNTVNSLLDITSLNSSLYSTAATDIKHYCNKSTTFEFKTWNRLLWAMLLLLFIKIAVIFEDYGSFVQQSAIDIKPSFR